MGLESEVVVFLELGSGLDILGEGIDGRLRLFDLVDSQIEQEVKDVRAP